MMVNEGVVMSPLGIRPQVECAKHRLIMKSILTLFRDAIVDG